MWITQDYWFDQYCGTLIEALFNSQVYYITCGCILICIPLCMICWFVIITLSLICTVRRVTFFIHVNVCGRCACNHEKWNLEHAHTRQQLSALECSRTAALVSHSEGGICRLEQDQPQMEHPTRGTPAKSPEASTHTAVHTACWAHGPSLALTQTCEGDWCS